uniref:Annexin n=1 Tax=Trichobilharzia regenti TaxID=157069 RepID=A0AA85J236_TRIRE|nr:unnamed protein product [Trichobilharzia regenti]
MALLKDGMKLVFILMISKYVCSINDTLGFGRERSLLNLLIGNGSWYEATLYPNGYKDAAFLHKILDCRDTEKLIKLLTSRTVYERQDIVLYYNRRFAQPISYYIKDMQPLVLRLMLTKLLRNTSELRAEDISNSLISYDIISVARTLIPLRNSELTNVRKVYEQHSFTDLSHDIESVSQGNVQRLLLCLVKAERDNITVDVKKNGERYSWLPFMNATLAKLEAHAIHKALKSKRRNEQAVLSDIFCKRTPYQLNMTSVYYEMIYKTSLEADIKATIKVTTFRRILLDLLYYAVKRLDFFAYLLRKTLFNNDVNHEALQILFITRSDIDLRGIGKAYNKLYNSSLVKDLKKKSYGCYRKILLSLLRGNYHPKNKLRIK